MGRDITKLHPDLQAIIPKFIADCEDKGLKVKITECLRTVEEQDAYYAKGRTVPGPKVTNAKGSSYSSMHQWGVAFDFCKNDSKAPFDDSNNFFSKVGAVGKSFNLIWGGDWTSIVDKPHFQLSAWGDTTSKLKELYGTPDKFIATWGKNTNITIPDTTKPNTTKEKDSQNSKVDTTQSSSNNKKTDAQSNILKRGSKGSKVSTLQTNLKNLGYNPKGADGSFGTNTEKAVIAFQKANGLEPDGIVGPKTSAMIDKLLQQKMMKEAKSKGTSIVVAGATLKCTNGSITTKLNVPKSHGAQIQGKNEATINDNKIGLNIGTFGRCKVLNTTCSPVINNLWKNSKSNYKLNNQQVLTKDSCLACNNNGIITITDDGQKTTTSTKKDTTTITFTTTRTLKFGSKGADVVQLQNALNELKCGTLIPDGNYRTKTKNAVIAFQRKYGLKPDGIVGPKTRAKIAELLKNNNEDKNNTKVSDDKKKESENKTTIDNKKDTTSKSETTSNKAKTSLEKALDIQMTKSPQKYTNVSGKSKWVNANKEDVLKYLDPKNYKQNPEKYQFLDLSAKAGISKEDMAKYLKNKGILAGKEEVYLKAAQKYCVSEVYLAAHSVLETGGGTSELAKGVKVDGVCVYNMYGIQAIDGKAVSEGSKYAKKMRWTSPEKAIDGGAKWISEQYINNSQYHQNTLYKMRWNPNNPGVHQYATDIRWAVNQAPDIKKLYDQFPKAELVFDITEYT